jgi:hypothetical protein
MPKPVVFISHITEESVLAGILKQHITRDFLNLLEVFVSSDEVSILAGSKWLERIDEALGIACIELVLCSRASVVRPWINFEAGAGWMRKIPVVPVCHSGLLSSDLAMPLSALQGIQANQERGLRRLYALVASNLGSAEPQVQFNEMINNIISFENAYSTTLAEITMAESAKEKAALDRMLDSLQEGKFDWRTVERLAFKGGVSESEAADILRTYPDVEFNKSKKGKLIARLKSNRTI